MCFLLFFVCLKDWEIKRKSSPSRLSCFTASWLHVGHKIFRSNRDNLLWKWNHINNGQTDKLIKPRPRLSLNVKSVNNFYLVKTFTHVLLADCSCGDYIFWEIFLFAMERNCQHKEKYKRALNYQKIKFQSLLGASFHILCHCLLPFTRGMLTTTRWSILSVSMT